MCVSICVTWDPCLHMCYVCLTNVCESVYIISHSYRADVVYAFLWIGEAHTWHLDKQGNMTLGSLKVRRDVARHRRLRMRPGENVRHDILAHTR